MKKEIILDIIVALGLVGLVLGLGFYAGHYLYPNKTEIINEKVIIDCKQQIRVAGLWVQNLSLVSRYVGTFICVNIDEVRDLKELKRVCEHESGHEIFARYCERNITKCEELE